MASSTDKFTKVGLPGSATTLASPGYSVGATSLNLTGATNWPTTTGVYFDIYLTQSVAGETVEVAGSRTTKKGLLSGNSISGLQHIYGTDQDYPAGSNTKVVITVSAPRENAMVEGLEVQHNLDGTHAAVTATSITSSGGLTVSGGSVTLPSASISQAALPIGAVVQKVTSTNSTYTSTTNKLIPYDNTIPQNTEGQEFMTASITPKSATNKLVVRCVAQMGTATANQIIGALFQGATANAFVANTVRQSGAPGPAVLVLEDEVTAGTTAALTFSFRAGTETNVALYFNGVAGQLFSTAGKSVISITEYKA